MKAILEIIDGPKHKIPLALKLKETQNSKTVGRVRLETVVTGVDK
jgi:hypothetical protein